MQDELQKAYDEDPSETARKALEAQKKVTLAAQIDLLEAAEKTAEAINNVYENEMNKLKKKLEEDLTGGLGFDRLQESMANVSEI
mgnify:CR=1 FL=1